MAPILASIAFSWWVARRLGAGALEAVPLLALVAGSLTLRLVFEVNLIAYYFLALTVSLVVLEATRGLVRRTTVAWLAILTLVICRTSELPFGFTRWAAYLQNDIVPILIGGAAILAVLRQLLRAANAEPLHLDGRRPGRPLHPDSWWQSFQRGPGCLVLADRSGRPWHVAGASAVVAEHSATDRAAAARGDPASVQSPSLIGSR